MDKQRLYKPSVYDIIFVVFIIVFSFSILPVFRNTNKQSVKKAVIYQNNKIIHEINLPIRTEKNTRIELGAIIIEIEHNKVRVLESDCPLRICKHTGWIDRVGQTIVCVPQKVLIEIAGSEQEAYNALSY